MSVWKPIEYDHTAAGGIILSKEAPFDGKPVLIRTNIGVVEAWWDNGSWSEDTPIAPAEFSGFCWVCYDDKFQCDLDEAVAWMPIPA